MDIRTQFDMIAEEYDCNRRRFIPCFEDYYVTSTELILSGIPAPRRVLDLGAGTGLLSYYWYRQCPQAEYVLTDIAGEMLAVARRRFAGIPTVRCEVSDYTRELPEGEFDAVISALSIHHLEDDQKRELFSRIRDRLPEGGCFANYDQFRAADPISERRQNAFWEAQLAKSGLTGHDIELWKQRRLLDRECSVEAELAMLRECGFAEAHCCYLYHKFAVIVAIR